MKKMSSLSESLLLLAVKAVGVFFQALPFGAAMGLAGAIGTAGYYISPKKRRVMYTNLRTTFAGQKSSRELRQMSKEVFVNLTKSFVELMYLPKMKRLGFERFVTVQGQENIDQAMARGKGAIFLALHIGNWELGSVTCSTRGYPYNIVANAHSKTPRLDGLLNKYRTIFGAKVIEPGTATRDIIRALHNNEIVCLVLDQGGKEGTPAPFLGKNASMSTGALRLAMKYGTPICPVRIVRDKSGHHIAYFYPALDMAKDKPTDKDLQEALQKVVGIMEPFVYEHPQEYMWFYKIFKYTTETEVLILNDGRTGHLRQSQTVAEILKSVAAQKNKTVREKTIDIVFKSPKAARVFSVYAFLTQSFNFLRKEDVLRMFLTEESYNALLSVRPDFIISCGSGPGGVSYFLSRCYIAKTICLLKAGLVSWEQFDVVILPQHDRPTVALRKPRLVLTKAALNLICPEYLKTQSSALLNHYSHLKKNVRTKIGVFLGGDAKGVVFSEVQARSVLRQIKEAALHFNADILLTTSRRTSPEVDAVVAKEMRNFERCALCVIANEFNMPEVVGGIAALSDFLIVSGESISMVSEAVCSGKRTIVFPPAGAYHPHLPANKYDRFVLNLNEEGFLLACSIKDLSSTIADLMRNKFSFKPLSDRLAVRPALEEIL